MSAYFITAESVTDPTDKALCEQARELDSWCEVDESKARTDAGREVLHQIKMYLYHREEAECGEL